jgi:predicted SpoU family rRNA methylase
MTVRFEFVDAVDNSVDFLVAGQDYDLQVFVQDSRATAAGIQQAYFDVTYNPGVISVTGAVNAGSSYALDATGTNPTDGLIDNAGGKDTDSTAPATPGSETLLFSVPVQAIAAGSVDLSAVPADLATLSPLFFGSDVVIPLASIEFVTGAEQVREPGVLVTPTTELQTTESGGTDSFEIVLLTPPTSNVTIALSTSDSTEGEVSPGSVTFNSNNWDTPQTITVSGIDDDVADGNVDYQVITGAAVSSDPEYSGVDANDVFITNFDDDSVGVSVHPTTGQTTEGGGTDTFELVLDSQPTSNVTVNLSSSNTAEGTVSPASVTFTPTTWNTSQIVTITGQDDNLADGNQTYSIVTSAAISDDPDYGGRDVANVSVTNLDDDSVGVAVQPTSGQTTEAGGTSTFEIRLTSQPAADVAVDLTSSNTNEGTVSPARVTFTSTNWSTPQIVTVTGQDDDLVDGNIPYTIVTSAAVSTDSAYAGREVADVSITNLDNDSAGISVEPTTGETDEAGATASFSITLTARPTADVTIGITSSDTTEGVVSLSSVTITPDTWNTPREIVVTGQNDDEADGNVAYSIITAPAVSSDPAYQGRDAADVSLVNRDNDAIGISVQPTTGETSEAGGTASFSVVLTSRPTAAVTIGISSSDPSEGAVNPTQLVFPAADWDTPQVVTVTGQDDAVADGDVTFSVITAPAVSDDSAYNGRNAADVTISNLDDDSAGFVVAAIGDLITTEMGTIAEFSIVLTSEPAANVSIGLSTSDATEGIPATSNLTFTPTNWDTPQTVGVQGQDDQQTDGNITYRIVTEAAASSDPVYNGLDVADVELVNLDNDLASVLILPTTGLVTSEAGQTASFDVRLGSQPTADVAIGLSTSDSSEGTIDTNGLLFTTENWNVLRTVTITGVDDDAADGDIEYSIITADATSSDVEYNGLDVDDIQVTNLDDDVANLVVTPTAGLVTNEDGGTATFSVVLTTQPTNDVVIDVTSDTPTEGLPTPAQITFTTTNWDQPQTISLGGVDDDLVDGDANYSVSVQVSSSDDPDYAALDPVQVDAVNQDTDVAALVILDGEELITDETGTNADFNVALSVQPTSDVLVAVTTSGWGRGHSLGRYVDLYPGNLGYASECHPDRNGRRFCRWFGLVFDYFGAV